MSEMRRISPKPENELPKSENRRAKNNSGLVQALSVCLVIIVGFFVGGIVIVLVIDGLVFLTGHWNDPLYGDCGLAGIPFPFVAAAVAFSIYFNLRQNWLSKRYITVRHFVCRNCKNEWTVTQDPTAKKWS